MTSAKKQFKAKINLTLDKQSIHECVLYSSNKFIYQSKNTSSLREHKTNLHEAVGYKCIECEYQATRTTHLKTHKRTPHKVFRMKLNHYKHRESHQIE